MSTNAPSSSALQVLRAAQKHHLALLATADLKASFLLAASLITLALTAPQANKDVTLMVLAITAALSAIFALKALTPRLLILRTEGAEPEMNLLFCGHFITLGENEYVEKLREKLGTDEGAFEALARDLFQMGMVLHQKKQHAVAVAYTICLLGLLATVVAAVVTPFIK